MRNWMDYLRFGGMLKKVTVLLVIAIAAIALAMATKPAFAVKDMRSLSTATAVAEGALAAAAAAASATAAGGTVKSLVARSGRRITGLVAIQALAYSVHKNYTLWIIAAAKFLSALSIALETDQLQPNYLANTLAIAVWIGALGSAVSAAILLSSRPGETIRAESARTSKARIVGFVIFLIGVALAFYLAM